MVHGLLGQIADTKGDLELAAEEFRKSIKLDPKQVVLYIALGQVRKSQGRYKDAVNCLEKALRLQPDMHWRGVPLFRPVAIPGRISNSPGTCGDDGQ